MNSEELWRDVQRRARARQRARFQEEPEPEERKPVHIVFNEHTCRECGKRLWIQPGCERMACDCGAVAWERRAD